MVDSIRFYTEITIHNLKPKVWRIHKNDKKGEQYYYKFENGVRFAFYPQTNSLIIYEQIQKKKRRKISVKY